MNLTPLRRASAISAVLGALLLSGMAAAPCAEKAAGTGTARSLEDQLEVLGKTLAESFQTRDWKMMELVADGLKAAGLEGANLEIFVLRAERDAALGATPGRAKPPILIWGLACRVKLGSTRAREELRKLAFAKHVQVESPQGKLLNEEFVKARRAYRQYVAALGRRDSALLAMAMLGDKDVLKPALERLRGKLDVRQSNRRNRDLVCAALAADPQGGWKKLVDFCSFNDGKEALFGNRAGILSTLASLANRDRPANRSAAFRVEGQIAALIPEDTGPQLRRAFTSLASKAPESQKPIYSYSLLATARAIPDFAKDDAAVAALKGLKGKSTGRVAQGWDRQVSHFLKEQGKAEPGKSPTVEKF